MFTWAMNYLLGRAVVGEDTASEDNVKRDETNKGKSSSDYWAEATIHSPIGKDRHARKFLSTFQEEVRAL